LELGLEIPNPPINGSLVITFTCASSKFNPGEMDLIHQLCGRSFRR
jgi:hypothetical protein